MFGLLKKNLELQDKLPAKWRDDIPDSPVTSGCVFYLDAINNTGEGHSNSISAWKNLAGSTDAKVFRNITWADDHVRIQKGGYILQALTSSSFTVELVFSLNSLNITDVSSDTGYLLTNVQTGGFGLGFTQGSNALSSTAYFGSAYRFSDVLIPAELNKKYYMRLNYNAPTKTWSTSVNNKYTWREEVSDSYKTTSAPVVLGYNPDSTGGLGSSVQQFMNDYNVYSARMYTRSLSHEELDQNLLYDRVRYNF